MKYPVSIIISILFLYSVLITLDSSCAYAAATKIKNQKPGTIIEVLPLDKPYINRNVNSPQQSKPVIPISSVKERSKPQAELIIDTFEDGNYTAEPEWWKFDRAYLSVVKNSTEEKNNHLFLGSRSLLIEGGTINWYIGGFGTYIGKDASRYNAVQMMIYGKGPGSGTLKIELYDDDNNNYETDINPAKGHQPVADDLASTRIDVNWTGWKTVTIPIADFEDENPGIGNDTWDPVQDKGSAGLLSVQIIALSPGKPIGKIDIKIDSITLIQR